MRDFIIAARALRSRQDVSKILSNVGWLFFDRIFRLGVGLVVGVWVARYLGPTRFGQLNFAVAYTALFGAATSLGLDQILVRELVHSPDEKHALLGTSLFLRLAAACIASIATSASILLVRHDAEMRLVVIISALSLIPAAFDTFDLWFQSQTLAKYATYARSAAFVIVSAAKVVLVLQHRGIIAFAWVTTAEFGIAAVGLVIVYTVRDGSVSDWTWQGSTARRLLRDSWPLVFSSVMIMIYLRIDQVMLGTISTDAEVGVYSVAVRLSEVWYFVPTAIVTSMFPAVLAAKKISEAVFLRRLQQMYNLVSVASYAIAIPISLLANPIVDRLYGAQYPAAGPVLIVLIWTLHFTALGIARSSFLTSMNWTRLHLATVSLGAAVNVLLNLWLIPRWGAMGAAVASLIAYWVAAHGTCYVYPRLRPTARMLTQALFTPWSVHV
jgi:O-antigen/teichoic acid export membrane protein